MKLQIGGGAQSDESSARSKLRRQQKNEKYFNNCPSQFHSAQNSALEAMCMKSRA
jgi:hypothetical protein